MTVYIKSIVIIPSKDLVIVCGSTEQRDFGNVKIGCDGGGHTLEFWSNKNGKNLFIDGNDIVQMTTLNLRDADGDDFDPGDYSEFRTWLLSANATNMAYMLSA
jgi:hypothetical protein